MIQAAIIYAATLVAFTAVIVLAYRVGKTDGERDERTRCIRRARVAGRWEAGVPGATCESVWRAVVEDLKGER